MACEAKVRDHQDVAEVSGYPLWNVIPADPLSFLWVPWWTVTRHGSWPSYCGDRHGDNPRCWRSL
jgi:hypothetical protein